jgi:GH18 family chitinase
MRVSRESFKDQVLIVLADYRSCKTDYAWEWEHEKDRVAEEMAKRMSRNFMCLAGLRELNARIDKAERKTRDMLLSEAEAA